MSASYIRARVDAKPPSPSMSIVRITDDQDPRVVYRGNWHALTNITDSSAIKSTLTYTNESSASATYQFSGETNFLSHYRSNKCGRCSGNQIIVTGYVFFLESTGPPSATFSIDNEAQYMYTPNATANLTYPIYLSSGILPSDGHTITVTVTSTNGAAFYLDSFTDIISVAGETSIRSAVPASTVSPTSDGNDANSRHRHDIGVVVGAVMAGACLVLLIMVGLLVRKRRHMRRDDESAHEGMSYSAAYASRRIDSMNCFLQQHLSPSSDLTHLVHLFRINGSGSNFRPCHLLVFLRMQPFPLRLRNPLLLQHLTLPLKHLALLDAAMARNSITYKKILANPQPFTQAQNTTILLRTPVSST